MSMAIFEAALRGAVLRLLMGLVLLGSAASCVCTRPSLKADFSFLRVDGTRVVDADGKTVALKGCNLGNWFLLEMWMLDLKNLGSNHNIPDQYTLERILRERFGAGRAHHLMEVYRANWIAERDFAMLKSFGFNVIRLPFHYSLLEDDAHPLELRPDAFRWLDQAVEWARKYGMYVILDLHGAPGGQSVDHTTGREGQNYLWSDEECRRRTVWLWRCIAERYRDEPVVAAYDLLNEPFGDYKTESHREALLSLMNDLYHAIREVDSRHIIILPGTREGIHFYGSPRARGWENVMFTEHYYPGVMYGSPSLEVHIEHINQTLYWMRHYLRDVEAPLLVGEFNVVFRRAGGPELMRYYFDVFARYGWWGTLWSYKLIHAEGGLGRDNWYLVTNRERAPKISLRDSSYEEILAFFEWLGKVPYAVDEELRAALTRESASALALERRPLWLEAPYDDDPCEWTARDIAAVPVGGQRVFSKERMDVFGGGQDIWGERDEFRFVWQEMAGNFEMEACVVEFDEAHMYSKAGLMLRNQPTPESAHILLHVFPDGRVAVGYRDRDGGTMRETKFPIRSFPIHLKLVRRGDSVRAMYRSLEDPGWRDAGEWPCEWMKERVCAGVAVLSHDRRFLARAAFDKLRIVEGGEDAP